ncbi:PTS sugar transporter subunit IIC [Anoxybacterium hadale]|uniref:PTS sugar transporter subunit IIC n=1 Tax=Anoxybacterium hadale TaxID=3408580 RepID=A0ACD1A7D1_9FIRM|nr:PTS sugar transporter subunit IIC [Clostridiales bacterium]
MNFLTVLKSAIDLFGAPIIVPIVVFLLSIALKVEVKKAFRGALFMGIGLIAFNVILGVLITAINPHITAMVEHTSVNLPIIDIGWPAGAAIVYANQLGMIYLVVGIGFNLLLYLIKFTDTFQPTDVWNYYYFVVFAQLVVFVTGSLPLGIISAMFMNLIVLLFADFLAPSLQEYYGYEGVTATCHAVVNISAFAIIVRWLLIKLKVKQIHIDPETIQGKFGFWGEPTVIGLIMGLAIGILGKSNDLANPASWANIIVTGFTVAAVMYLYPSISGMFVRGIIPISQTLNARFQSGEAKRKNINIGIDPAVFFGESATLTTGLILIPILIATAVILPGNQTLPLADLPAMPFMAIGAIAVFQGNILNSVVTGTIWYSICHYINTDVAANFTKAAVNAGVQLPDTATTITSWCIGANPIFYVVYKAFSQEGIAQIIGIAAVVAVYVIAVVHFKRHRKQWYLAAGASEDFVNDFLAKGELAKA